MSDISQLINDVQSIANKFSSFARVSEALSKLGNIQQVERESIQKRDEAKKAADEAVVALAEKRAEVKVAADEVGAANKRAADIIALAEAKGLEIVSVAKEQADKVASDAVDRKAEVAKEIKQLHSEKVSVESVLSAKQAELAELSKKLSELKAKISGLV